MPKSVMKIQLGITYLALLFFIAIVSIALTATGLIWSLESKRLKEAELLAVGHEFRRAIQSYYEGSPTPNKHYPSSLIELLKDGRYLVDKRHLRQIYLDPMTGSQQWGLLKAPEGGIMGVHSLAVGRPLKQANFSDTDKDFSGQDKYKDWAFVYRPVISPKQ